MRGKGIIITFLAFVIMFLYSETVFASDYVISSDGRYRYEIFNTEDEDYVYIREYIGEESSVVIPDVLDGYVVRGFHGDLLYQNTTVKEITLPNTISHIELGTFSSAYALENIHMEDGFSNAFHTEDGILYNGNGLHSYPSGRKDTTFVVPKTTGVIAKYAFYGCIYLEKVVVPETARFTTYVFARCKQPLDIVIRKDTYKKGYLDRLCWQMPVGTRLLVANEELAEQYTAEMHKDEYYAECRKSQNGEDIYYNIEGLMAVEVYEPVSATDLTFADGSREKHIVVEYNPDADETYTCDGVLENEITSRLQFDDDFMQYPPDTTELVSWSAAGDNCFRFDVDRQFISANLKGGGEFTVTGRDESGHEITAYVTVKRATEKFEIKNYHGNSVEEISLHAELKVNPFTCFLSTDSYAVTKIQSGSEGAITIETEDESVAKITDITPTTTGVKFNIEAVWPGTTTLHVTVSDNGTPLTKSLDVCIWDYASTWEVETIPNQVYDGTESSICPKPVVRYKNNQLEEAILLEEGTDYTLEYKNYLNASSPQGFVRIIPVDNELWSGARSINYKIIKPEPKPEDNPSGGEALVPSNPSGNENAGNKPAENHEDLTEQKIVKVKTPTISSAKSNKKESVTIKWKKVSDASGYEIECATNKKFTKNKKNIMVKKSSKSKTIKNLKSGKKYYFRLYAYKKINGVKYYSTCSEIKKVKVK